MSLVIREIGDRRTAIVTELEDLPDVEKEGVDSLWIHPSSSVSAFDQSPVHFSDVKELYVKDCALPLLEIFAFDVILRLEKFIIANSPEAFDGFLGDSECSSLRSVVIRDQCLSSAGLDWIHANSQLEMLCITNTDVDDEFLRKLNCSNSLRRLDIFRNREIRLGDCVGELQFPKVSSLDISETSIDGRSVSVIFSAFPALERLLASGTMLKKSDAEKLSNLNQLKILQTGFHDIDFDHHGDKFWDL